MTDPALARRQPDDPGPYYEAHVFCCTNERPEGHKRGSCGAKGSLPLRNYLKARLKELGLIDRLRASTSGCLDRCELGCVMVIYPEQVWYTYRTQADVEEILQTHLLGGGRVARLMLTPDQEELTPAQAGDRAA